jgi:SAM-dependent methyltransferase
MDIAQRVSTYNRERKWAQFLALIEPKPGLRILDVGYTEKEHQTADNYLEKHYPYPGDITALGVDEPVEFSKRYPKVRAIKYDGTNFPFEDKSFDITWSNAVIEHVGDAAAQTKFLSEIVRVSQLAFVTTPNRYFPLEVHTRLPFLHWLPKPVFDRILVAMNKGWAAGEYMDLLGENDFRKRLADVGVTDYRFLKNRLAGVTMDFVAIIGSSQAVPERSNAAHAASNANE